MISKNEVRFTFLGGVGEIGMNCLAVETARGIVIVDCGVMFPDDRVSGPDLIIPDLRYFRANRDRIVGVVITHGHEDHIGAVPIVFGDIPVSIFAPPFAAALIREKSLEYVTSPAYELNTVAPGDRLEMVGLEFEFFRVTHTIPDALGMAIRTPAGLIVHTGDFRIDDAPSMGQPFDREALARFGDEGVLLLLSDSTNAEVPGRTRNESWVGESILELATGHPGRILATLFSSNVERIGRMAEVARKLNRRLGLVGRSLHSYTRAGMETGYAPFGPNDLIDAGYAGELRDRDVFLLISGSQGENRAALTRVAAGEHPDVRVQEGDLVIFSSKRIPGNEKGIQRVANELVRQGAIVLDEANASVHTSGHAHRDELVEVLELVRPKYLVPVHGEYRFLYEHARLAAETVKAKTVIADWGSVLRIKNGVVEKTDELELQHYFVERPLIGSGEELKLRERRKLGYNGMVVVTCRFVKRKRGASLDTDFTFYGVPDPDGSLADSIRERLRIEFINRHPSPSAKTIEDEVRVIIRRVVRKHQGRKPLVHVIFEATGAGSK